MQLPPAYLNDAVFEPLAGVMFINLHPDHKIWEVVAPLNHWPVMRSDPDALFCWLQAAPMPTKARLLKLVLSQRLPELIGAVVAADKGLHGPIMETVVDHYQVAHRSCTESFYRPVHDQHTTPRFTIHDNVLDAVDAIAAQHCHNDANDETIAIMSYLLQFHALSSSELAESSRPIVIGPIVNRDPALIDHFRDHEPSSATARLFMASIASTMRSIDSHHALCRDALCAWLVRDPCSVVCAAFCVGSNAADFDSLVVAVRAQLPASANAVAVLVDVLARIRYRTGHCRVIDKHSTGLIIGLGAAIALGIDDAVDALCAIVNDLQSVKVSLHQAALIVSALRPEIQFFLFFQKWIFYNDFWQVIIVFIIISVIYKWFFWF